jgi:hypothetical protein
LILPDLLVEAGNDDDGDAQFLETTLVQGVLSDSQTAKTDVVLEAMARLVSGRQSAVESSSASALVGVPTEDTLMVGVPMEDALMVGVPMEDALMVGVPMEDTPMVGVSMVDVPMMDVLREGKGNIAKFHKTKDGNGAVVDDVLLDGGGGTRWGYFANRTHDLKHAEQSKLKEKGAHREIVVGWVLGIQGFHSRQRMFSHPMSRVNSVAK